MPSTPLSRQDARRVVGISMAAIVSGSGPAASDSVFARGNLPPTCLTATPPAERYHDESAVWALLQAYGVVVDNQPAGASAQLQADNSANQVLEGLSQKLFDASLSSIGVVLAQATLARIESNGYVPERSPSEGDLVLYVNLDQRIGATIVPRWGRIVDGAVVSVNTSDGCVSRHALTAPPSRCAEVICFTEANRSPSTIPSLSPCVHPRQTPKFTEEPTRGGSTSEIIAPNRRDSWLMIPLAAIAAWILRPRWDDFRLSRR